MLLYWKKRQKWWGQTWFFVVQFCSVTGSRGPPWAERGNNCTLWAGFGDWSILTTGFRNKSPLWATHRNRSPFWARLRIWGPFWAGHETKSPLWAERGLRVLSGLDSGTASIEATSEASSWEWPPWPWQQKQHASEEPLLTRPTRIVPVDKTRLMDKVSRDMTWPWSWAGADTGVNSGAGANTWENRVTGRKTQHNTTWTQAWYCLLTFYIKSLLATQFLKAVT